MHCFLQRCKANFRQSNSNLFGHRLQVVWVPLLTLPFLMIPPPQSLIDRPGTSIQISSIVSIHLTGNYKGLRSPSDSDSNGRFVPPKKILLPVCRTPVSGIEQPPSRAALNDIRYGSPCASAHRRGPLTTTSCGCLDEMDTEIPQNQREKFS